jgi:hypothetical protein
LYKYENKKAVIIVLVENIEEITPPPICSLNACKNVRETRTSAAMPPRRFGS